MKKVYGRNIHRRQLTMLKNKTLIIICIVVALVVVGIGAYKARSSARDSGASGTSTFEVQQGPLTISVIEAGTIKAREQIILKCEVEGQTSIISLVDEGTRVKKGDLLVELDASKLLDTVIDEEIKTEDANAAFIGARENLAVVENKGKSDVDLAKLTLTFAKQDLDKYIKGEYINELRKAESAIILAQEELTRANDTLEWSKTLHAEKYISQTELQADELSQKKRQLDLELAKSDRDLLKNYTYQRNVDQFVSDVNQAGMALERTQREANANIAQARATLRARDAEYRRQVSKLEKNRAQITKTKIYAPADGLVIYATSARRGGYRSRSEPLDEGQAVYERQELIYLPTAASSKAEVDIHESHLQKIHEGLPAIITVEALQSKRYLGTLQKIAPLPDAQSMWINDPLLRTGMSCLAEIIVARYDDAVYIPVQAVMRVDGEPTVYVVNGKALEPRTVEIGLDNNRMIHILSGLNKGDVVSLAPPLESAEVDENGSGAVNGQNGNSLAGNGSDFIDDRIDSRLKQSKEMISNTEQPKRKREGKKGSRGGKRGDRERRKGFEDLSEEERAKMKKRFSNMSEQEKQKMRQQYQSGGGRPKGSQ
jgi:HlyD family secretion protein